MIVGKVIDMAVSTRKHPALQGIKLLLVEPVADGVGKVFLAGDILGAGVGEYVMTSQGTPASNALESSQNPVDAMVVGILDYLPEILTK